MIDKCLRRDGRGLIHSIGRNRPRIMNRWIEKRIFPGAYPPTLKEMSAIFEPHDFSVLDVENLRLHYALTLEHWLDRFEQNLSKIRERFDDRFVRAWRLYLTGSIAAFRLGDLQLFQVVFNRGDSNDVPMTRKHLYT
jgi:cyclopropane-fatty-acyl-phospholipid synthase